MEIVVNEQTHDVPESLTLGELRDELKPDADVIIVNGYPSGEGTALREGDHVVLIRRGEVPSRKDLEALFVARHTPGIHERIKQAAVGIAGLGGLGSSVSTALARMGIGTLILVDYDVVEPSNLNRQQYFIDQIGTPKTEAMIKNLTGINPYVKVLAHKETLTQENVARLFKPADVIVECFDRAEEKKMILEAVLESLPETFFVGASGLAGYGDSNSIKTWRLSGKAFIIGDLERAAEPGLGLMAPRVGIAAHHQANLVISLLVDPARTVSNIPEIP
jgi:sulfur carrier protein ThiS adenylyltransferase